MTTAKDTIDTVLFTDGIKRVLQTKKDATVAGQDVMIVSGRVLFDKMGRTVQQYYPVTEAKGGNTTFNPAFDTVTPTVTSYDVLDRTLSTTLPDGSPPTTMAYGFGTDRDGATQFQTKVTDANGKIKYSYRDIRELITTVTEVNQGQTLHTSYAYDPLKQITRVLDANNNATRIRYDNLGRRTVIANPDTGETDTVYDLAGNPVRKITAVLKLQGKAIAYDYDQNRLIAVHYPDNPGNDVSYTYGDNSASARKYNQIGRVVQITSQAGVEQRQYGKLGEVVQETRTVNSHTQGNSANSPEVYTTGYGFDTFGRLMTLTLPDGEILTHHYDSGGNVTGIEGDRPAKSGSGAEHTDYLQSLLYDQFEQRTLVKLGNGIETRYTYQADNRRLARLVSTGNSAGTFQNLGYRYDLVGNITSLTNDVAIAPANTFGGPTRHSYGYDDLYRLTSAGGSFTQSPGKERRYTLALQYDAVHNIVNKTQTDTLASSGNQGIAQKGTTYDWAYAYQGSGPHAPTHIGDRTFYYDANGNQTGYASDRNGTKRTISWDEDNRIQSIADNGSTTDYQYDDQGRRIVKTGKQGETVYVNQFYVVRNRSIVSKHVFAGTSRLATKLETGNGNTRVPPASPTIASATTGVAPGPQITSPDGSASTTATVQDLAGSAIAKPATANAGTANPATPLAAAEGKNSTLSVEGEEQGKGKKRGNAQGQASKLADGPHQTTLPGNSEAALEHALASGQGNKTGIYQRLDRLGYQVDNNGRIVPRDGSGTGGTPGGGTGGTGGTTQAPQHFLYFYHPDHLGSTGYVTDASGKLYEHLEYFPFGETWVQESSNTQRTPYLFTGKEFDEETQLYYFGARYYDPRTSVWQSADPILEKYLPNVPTKSEEAVKLLPPTMRVPIARFNLPGAGGVYNSMNIGLYTYSYQNPINLKDPDGRNPILVLLAFGLTANEIATSDVPIIGGGFVKAAGAATNSAQKLGRIFAGNMQVERVAKRIENIVSKHLKPDDLAGAVKDILGKPIVINGKTYDHLKEVTDGLSGLKNSAKEIGELLQKDGLNTTQRETLQEALGSVSKHIDRVEKILDTARKQVE